jgi:hypothetical protein
MKKTAFLHSIITVAVAAILFGELARSDAGSDKEEIAAIRAESNEAIQRHDAEGIVILLDDQYQINTGSGLLSHGDREAEKENWAELFSERDDVVYVRTPTRIEVSSYLPRAAEFGDWVGNWTTENGPIEVGGSYSASWRKVDGNWKIQSEIFVTLFCNGDTC